MATKATTREGEFEQHKQSGEAMVHRLRDWSPGDKIVGYDVVSENASHGKTFQIDRERSLVDSVEDVKSQAQGPLYDPDSDSELFVWTATIESVTTEPPGPDPGEPPLTFARLSDVSVEYSDL